MIIELPSDEERAALLSLHASRFPERFDFSIVSDGGKLDTVAVLLGNPLDDSDEWEQTIAATFKPRKFDGDARSLVASCVLWPDAKTWGSIVNRWPALPVGSVKDALLQKCGSRAAALTTPVDEPSDMIAAALAANPSAAWRRVKLDAESVDFVIAPPTLRTWSIFEAQLKQDDVKCWPLIRDLALTSVITATRPVVDVIARWPGCASLLMLAASTLAGAGSEYEKKTF